MSETRMDKIEAKPVRVAAVPTKKVTPVAIPRRKPAMPAKEVRPRTVKGKVAYYQSATRKMQESVRAVQSGIKEQMKENKEAVAKIQSGINKQIEENLDYVKKFYG